MLSSNGFSDIEVCIVENNRESIDSSAQKYKGQENTVLVLERVSLWRKYKDVFKEHGLKCQLASLMHSFFDVMKPALWEACELLEDDGSKEIFSECLNVRYKIKSPEVMCRYFDSNQYFAIPEMNHIDPDGVFIDCGAFVGDTVELFIQRSQSIFKKIFAFEPLPRQFDALQKRKKRLAEEWALDDDQIVCFRAGVGSHTMKAMARPGELNQHIISTRLVEADENSLASGEATDIYALDDVCGDENIRFIKADVEGYEMDMLRGAERIIREHKPCLAISLYHKLTDYYEIPLYIKSLVPEYKMKVRHHSTDFPETVLYCYC